MIDSSRPHNAEPPLEDGSFALSIPTPMTVMMFVCESVSQPASKPAAAAAAAAGAKVCRQSVGQSVGADDQSIEKYLRSPTGSS